MKNTPKSRTDEERFHNQMFHVWVALHVLTSPWNPQLLCMQLGMGQYGALL
jgi:hypothetical protein